MEVTDWAANGTGAGSFLNLTFAGVETISSLFLTDRTTSGGNNGAFAGGTTDFTTQFSLQAFTDSTFTVPIGPALTFSKTTPTSPTTIASFQVTEPLGGLIAQYVRYTVNAANGPNPGLADIEFDVGTVLPEPLSISLLCGGLLGLGVVRRRRR